MPFITVIILNLTLYEFIGWNFSCRFLELFVKYSCVGHDTWIHEIFVSVLRYKMGVDSFEQKLVRNKNDKHLWNIFLPYTL